MNKNDDFNISLEHWQYFADSYLWRGPFIWNNLPKTTPYSSGLYQQPTNLPTGTESVTKSVWEALPWNPGLGYDYHDPEAIDKPSWDEVVDAFKGFAISTRGITDPASLA